MSEALPSNDTAPAGIIRRTVKACDACRKRKVRCRPAVEGPCQQCSHLNIPCIFSSNSISKRSRKTAAPRGTVIQSCRMSATASPTVAVPSPTDSSTSLYSSPNSITSPRSNPVFTPQSAEATFFLDLLPDYMANVYPVNPVITEDEVRSCVLRMHADSDALSFLFVYASVTVHLSYADRPADIQQQISSLLQSSLEHRKALSHLDPPPSCLRIMTDIFTEIVLAGLRKPDLGAMYLRSAISQVMMLPLNDPSLTFTERLRRERLYWECFIHERFTAISCDKTILLDPLPSLPSLDPTLPLSLHQGWLYTIQTFTLIDRDFVDFWLRYRRPPPEWVQDRHRQLEDDQWRMDVAALPKMQQADIIVTRQWLRTTLWQMAISNMILSASPAPTAPGSPRDLQGNGISLTLPLRLSHELKTCLEGFQAAEVGVHGSGILHKLFEITNAIVDVILHLPDAPGQDTRERVVDLIFLKRLMFGFPRMDRTHRRILEGKFEMVRGVGKGEEWADLVEGL